ncbi:hypothetical protein ABE41_006125 [Fictibacillus arsenicus]|uniref:DUF3021 domain-containing protein n=1 Tax=Fictibacillus arsenicus TaxID=255247 RepID=A0A1B1Z285_9BACL|nr:hypothetical protein [Fictibacillus arsenicus]ANX11578.1 hypothetical protein ABE41_006125 [Fictibacillus arsenicus]
MSGGDFILIRKIVVAIFTSCIITILNVIILGMELGLLIGMYLCPIVIFYGCLSSLVSDYITNRAKGFQRLFTAGLLHMVFAILFLIPILISERTNDLNIRNIVSDIFLMQSIMCSILFWLLDEFLRREKIKSKWRILLNKIGDLRM